MKNEKQKELIKEPAKSKNKSKQLDTEQLQSDPVQHTEVQKSEDSVKKFEKDDLLRFKLAEAKYQNTNMFVQLKTHEFEKAKAAWEAHGRELIAEIERGQANFQQSLKDLIALREELGKKYNVNFDNISYHESTGVIYEHVNTNLNQ
jgi:hypothetical protein